MAGIPKAAALPEKHTFIHFEEPSSLTTFPTRSAPGTLLGKSFRTKEPTPDVAAVKHSSWNIFHRMFSKAAATEERPPQAEAWSPIKIQQKNTFVHFDDPRTPTAPAVSSAPGTMHFLGPPPPAGSLGAETLQSDSSRSLLSSVQSSAPSMPSLGAADQVVVSHAALDRTSVPAVAGTFTKEAVQLSRVVDGQRAGAPSLGSEGHCKGQCIPCLMQVRWQVGKSAQPCKFGALCGRCHAAHTEAELHQVQVKMRKQKHLADIQLLISSMQRSPPAVFRC